MKVNNFRLHPVKKGRLIGHGDLMKAINNPFIGNHVAGA
jgi:hypothetical protein